MTQQLFQVGKDYRNRTGQYVVLSIDGDEMTIRYTTGAVLKTKMAVQARIWENIQFEEQMVREEKRRQMAQDARQAARKRSSTKAKKAKSSPKFPGFEAEDFEPKSRGISWSSREEMGKLLAFELSQSSQSEFGHSVVPRRSEVHMARQEFYDREDRTRQAAFFVSVDEKGVLFGFRVGRPGGKPKNGGQLIAFLEMLSEDDKRRRALRAAMKDYDLSLDVYAMDVSYGQIGQIVVEDRGFLWQHETADQEVSRKMNWQDILEYLESVASDKQCDLFVRKQVLAAKALTSGDAVLEEMLAVFEALLPVYDACVGE